MNKEKRREKREKRKEKRKTLIMELVGMIVMDLVIGKQERDMGCYVSHSQLSPKLGSPYPTT